MKPLPRPAEIRYGPSRFTQLTDRSGGVSRETAIENARLAISAVSALSKRRITENIAVLEDLSERIGSDSSALDIAYEKSSEIAEVASILDYEGLPDVAVSLCELIVRMKATQSVDPDRYVVHVEALRYSLALGGQGMSAETSSLLIEKLASVVNQTPKGTESVSD